MLKNKEREREREREREKENWYVTPRKGERKGEC
jgi:hypothetical protein